MKGCELIECSDFKNGICYYDGPICKYREENILTVKSARSFMNTSLQDESLRQGYRANIAMLIYDDQVAGIEGRSHEPPTNLSTKEGCNSIAERIIDLIFK